MLLSADVYFCCLAVNVICILYNSYNQETSYDILKKKLFLMRGKKFFDATVNCKDDGSLSIIP